MGLVDRIPGSYLKLKEEVKANGSYKNYKNGALSNQLTDVKEG